MLNIDFFSKIEKINNLFSNLDYKSIKNIDKDIKNIYLIFEKIDNIEDEYKIKIYSDNNIKVTIPVKNSNYKYTTCLQDIDSVYDYLYYHLYNLYDFYHLYSNF